MTSLLPPTIHPALLATLAVVSAAYAWATRRGRASPRERRRFAGAVVLTFVVCWWPLGDLASHVSITAVVVQRLVLMLAVAPLLLASIPTAAVARLTRPAVVDRVADVVVRPAIAVAIVTIVGTVTLLPVVIAWDATTPLATGIFVAVTIGLGIVLWMPVLGTVPGLPRLSYMAKGGYLLVASLVVTSLSFIWIFARHPMYHSFTDQSRLLGLSPLLDQQLAGFVSKLGAYFPMWAIAFVLFARAGDGGDDDQPELRWVDVERELERADRTGATDHVGDAGHGVE